MYPLFPLFLCLISFLLFPCAVFGRTLVHEFHITCINTNGTCFFFAMQKSLFFSLIFVYQKLKYNNNNNNILYIDIFLIAPPNCTVRSPTKIMYC